MTGGHKKSGMPPEQIALTAKRRFDVAKTPRKRGEITDHALNMMLPRLPPSP